MGLVLVQEIISLYDGELKITSEKNEFTTIRIIFKVVTGSVNNLV